MHRLFRAALVGLAVLLACVGCPSDPAKRNKPAVPEPTALTPLPPGEHQQTVQVPGGSSLHYTISVPPGYAQGQPTPLIVALHYGGDVTPFYGRGVIDELVAPALGELGAIIVAPDALGGGDWTTAENEKAVIWLTRSVMKSYSVDPKKVLVTGYSMGGQGAWFLGGRYQDLFTAVIPVAGEPAGGSLQWTVPVYVIHSQNDQIIPYGPVQKHVEQLKAKGANVELKTVSGLTHYQTTGFVGPLHETVPWLRQAWK